MKRSENRVLRGARGDSPPGTVEDGFDETSGQDGGTPTYKERFFSQETLSYASGLYTLTDTLGDQFVFYGFDASLNVHERGQIKSFTDPAGNQITFNYADPTSDSGWPGSLESVTRTDGTVTETWTYAYNAVNPDDPLAPYELSLLTLSRSGGSTSGTVEQVAYTYYGTGDPNGMQGNLETAQLQDASRNPLATYYYRYFIPVAGLNSWGLDLAVGPSGYARFENDYDESPDDASDSDLQPYADYYFGGYDLQGQVIWQSIIGTGASGSVNTAGTHSYSYDTSNSFAVGTNVWENSTTVTLQDGGTEAFYSNYAGEVMLDSESPSHLPGEWDTAYIYDSAGHLTLQAMPSAVMGYDVDASDLLSQNADGTYQFLSSDSGLIDQTVYFTSATSSADNPIGYVSETDQLEGDQGLANLQAAVTNGTRVPMSNTTYVAHTDGSATIYEVASQTQYAGMGYGAAEQTLYAYPEWDDVQPAEVETTPPVVPTTQNGTGTAQPTTNWYDQYGWVIFAQDALGYIDYAGYDDATGAVTYSVIDADPQNLPGGATAPGDLTRSADLPTPLALTTSTTDDNLGRPKQITDPNGDVTSYLYFDSSNLSEMDVIPLTGPMQVSVTNYALGFMDTATFTSGTPFDLSDQTTGFQYPLSLTREFFDNAGRVMQSDSYWSLASVNVVNMFNTASIGSINTNYYETTYTYGSDGLQQTVTDPLATTTTTLYDGLNRVIATEMSNPNVSTPVPVETEQYDGGLVGDGNLTQDIEIPGPDGQGLSLPNHVTTNYYNWKDELVASNNTVQVTYDTMDNLGEVTQQDTYDATSAGLAAFVGPYGFVNGIVVPPSAGTSLRARTLTSFNADGEVYSTTQVGVNPNNGALSAGLVTLTFYDADGDVIATSNPTGLWTKTTYDGAGRPIAVYDTDNAGNDPASVSGDNVLSQTLNTYDADGDTIGAVTSDRLATDEDTEDNSEAETGPLGDANGNGGPAASVATVQYVYNAADQLTETDNFGANPYNSDNTGAIISQNVYNNAGQVQYAIQNAGTTSSTTTYYTRDMLGRVSAEVDNYVSGLPVPFYSAPSVNKETLYTYNGDNEVRTAIIVNVLPSGVTTSGGAAYEDQQTTYTYGQYLVNLSLLSSVKYPDGTQQSYLYDHLGDMVQEIQQDGTIHQYRYDTLGNQISDFVSHFGPGVDNTVQALTTTYNVLGQPVLMSSMGIVPQPSQPGGTAWGYVNQVEDVYNSYCNLAAQYQEANGAVNLSTSLSVQYQYNSSDPTELQDMVYPDGRKEYYQYSGLDSEISRVTSVNDPNAGNNAAGAPVEQYSYQGLSTVVGKTRPQENVTESISFTPYGQPSTVQWSNNGTPTDSVTYSYDNFGDVLTVQNNINSYASETFGYDGLHRMDSFLQSPLDTGVSFAWTLDSDGDKFGGKYGNSYAGQNHVTAAGTATGNDQTVSLPAGTVVLKYDAWGRVVSATAQHPVTNYDSEGNPYTTTATDSTDTYRYDALGREISDVTANSSGQVTSTDALLYSGQDVIEERNATGRSGTVTAQYVWSAAGPNTLILRDSQTTPSSPGTSTFIPQITGAPLNQRLYAQDEAEGSITSITSVTGAVVERYLYDQDGQPTAIQANWNAWPSVGNGVGNSQYGWVYLYGGQRAQAFTFLTSTAGQGVLYTSNAGATWYDPYHGINLQPDYSNYAPGTTPYDPNNGDTGLARLWDNSAGYIAVGATIGLGVAASIATGGLAGAALGALAVEGGLFATAISGAAAGAAGGFIGGAAQAYGSGANGSGVLAQGGIGALAGAAGGAAGAFAGSLAGSLTQTAGLTCANGLGQVGSFINGMVEGGTFGLTEGVVRGGINDGWSGALSEGYNGLLAGGFIGGTLGAVLGNACFAAGTMMLVPRNKEGGFVWKRIEDLREGDLIWTRDENDPNGPLKISRVDAVFVRMAKTLALTVGSRVIRTTAEHRCYAQSRAWTGAGALEPGDLMPGHNSRLTPVAGIRETGEFEVVHNVRIAEGHTYFVGGPEWGFSVWAHNTCSDGEDAALPSDREMQAQSRDQDIEEGLSIHDQKFYSGEGGDAGVIYEVPGSGTPSGRPYIGSADNLEARAASATDGRDRSLAYEIGEYPIGDIEARRIAEQDAIDTSGGISMLDNKRNEIAKA